MKLTRRAFITGLWRIQQSYALLSIVLWGLLITFTFYPIFAPVWFGFIPAGSSGAVLSALAVIFLSVFGLLYLFGLIYDKYLRLWREQMDIAYDRNPYAGEKLAVKEILMWRHTFIPTMQIQARNDPKIRREVKFIENWIDSSMQDPRIKTSVDEAERRFYNENQEEVDETVP